MKKLEGEARPEYIGELASEAGRRKKLKGHTPGPWRVRQENDRAIISGGEWGSFAEVIIRMDDETVNCPEGEANAALIAQVPTLLEQRDRLREALRGLVTAWRLPPAPMPLTEAVQAASAKVSEALDEAERVLREVEKS